MPSLIDIVKETQRRATPLPNFEVGYTIQVNYRIIEGEKERVQAFVGVVLRKHLGDKNTDGTFTVRKVTQGHGVERIFPTHSPRIESIEILKKGKVRQARLYYLRELSGKAARIREKMSGTTKTKRAPLIEEVAKPNEATNPPVGEQS